MAFMRKAVRKRSRLLKPAGLGSLEGLSSMESTLPVSFFPVPTDSLALGRRTRSSKLNFWLKWKRKKIQYEVILGIKFLKWLRRSGFRGKNIYSNKQKHLT